MSGDASVQDEPDAVARGWVGSSDGTVALFMLVGTSLGVSDLEQSTPLDWYDLRELTGLDALGDPVGDLQAVELVMQDGRRMTAGWPEPFCSRVVDTLMATLPGTDGGAPSPATTPRPTDAAPAVAPPSAPVTAAEPGPEPGPATSSAAPPTAAPPTAAPPTAAPPTAAPPTAAPPTAAPSTAATRDEPAAVPPPAAASSAATTTEGSVGDAPPPGPAGSSPALVLEDVTYLGGFPGHAKKRKRCTATLTRDVVEVTGPKGMELRVPWSEVRTLEAQNADEARFRMNTRIHRDATALVLECDEDVTLLLEARDCPTVPLRGAIAQLVDDLPVVVV